MCEKKAKFRVSTLVGCLVSQLCVGILYLWSVFKAPAIEYYGWEAGAVNMVASIMLFCFCGGSLIGGAIQDRSNPRISALIGIFLFGGGILASSLIPADGSIVLFYLCYCVLGGLGSGFVYGSALNCLQRWLPHRRGLATGLAASTFGLSTVVFSPLCSMLLGKMPMPNALRLLAGVLFVIGVAACLFISLPGEEYLKTIVMPQKPGVIRGENSLSTLQAMKKPAFWLFVMSMFVYNATWNMLTPLIKGLGMDRGLEAAAAVAAVSMTGLTNAAGRLLMSALSDKIGRVSTMYILCAITFVSGVGLIFARGTLYIVFVLLTAFAFGGPAAVYPAMCTDIFGPKYAGTNYGVIMMALGVSAIAFNALSNLLYGISGGYVLTFAVGAATAVLTLLLVNTIKRLTKCS